MLSALIGVVMSIVIISFAKATRFEDDRSFFPTLLIVIAFYYVLFSVMQGHSITRELLVASIFVFIALLGARKSEIIVGFGILLHAAYDLFHIVLFSKPVAPIWWSSFCSVIDLVLGVWVIYLAKYKHKKSE